MDRKLYTGGPLVDDLQARVEYLEKENEKHNQEIEKLTRAINWLKESCASRGIYVV